MDGRQHIVHEGADIKAPERKFGLAALERAEINHALDDRLELCGRKLGLVEIVFPFRVARSAAGQVREAHDIVERCAQIVAEVCQAVSAHLVRIFGGTERGLQQPQVFMVSLVGGGDVRPQNEQLVVRVVQPAVTVLLAPALSVRIDIGEGEGVGFFRLQPGKDVVERDALAVAVLILRCDRRGDGIAEDLLLREVDALLKHTGLARLDVDEAEEALFDVDKADEIVFLVGQALDETVALDLFGAVENAEDRFDVAGLGVLRHAREGLHPALPAVFHPAQIELTELRLTCEKGGHQSAAVEGRAEAVRSLGIHDAAGGGGEKFVRGAAVLMGGGVRDKAEAVFADVRRQVEADGTQRAGRGLEHFLHHALIFFGFELLQRDVLHDAVGLDGAAAAVKDGGVGRAGAAGLVGRGAAVPEFAFGGLFTVFKIRVHQKEGRAVLFVDVVEQRIGHVLDDAREPRLEEGVVLTGAASGGNVVFPDGELRAPHGELVHLTAAAETGLGLFLGRDVDIADIGKLRAVRLIERFADGLQPDIFPGLFIHRAVDGDGTVPLGKQGADRVPRNGDVLRVDAAEQLVRGVALHALLRNADHARERGVRREQRDLAVPHPQNGDAGGDVFDEVAEIVGGQGLERIRFPLREGARKAADHDRLAVERAGDTGDAFHADVAASLAGDGEIPVDVPVRTDAAGNVLAKIGQVARIDGVAGVLRDECLVFPGAEAEDGGNVGRVIQRPQAVVDDLVGSNIARHSAQGIQQIFSVDLWHGTLPPPVSFGGFGTLRAAWTRRGGGAGPK